MALYRAARDLERPVLGICRGGQLMNVAEGGSLWQDLPSLRPDTETHRDQELYCRMIHPIRVAEPSLIAELFAGDPRRVNTVHHQGLRVVAPCFRVTAWAPDGVAEAIEGQDGTWRLGVQWHPEWMVGVPSQERLFARFVAQARGATA